jgi:hypothetical protein
VTDVGKYVSSICPPACPLLLLQATQSRRHLPMTAYRFVFPILKVSCQP